MGIWRGKPYIYTPKSFDTLVSLVSAELSTRTMVSSEDPVPTWIV